MKGAVACCLEELVLAKFGKDQWEAVLTQSSLAAATRFLCTADIPDETVKTLVKNTCDVLGISIEQVADAFGDYWVNTFAAKIYQAYYPHDPRQQSAKAFLLNMDSVHEMVTKHMPNAHPPRFQYEWRNERTLIMHYQSARGLLDFLVGLIKGVGTYYNEELKVTKLGTDRVEILFSQVTQEGPHA